ncbi:hypothetical protein LFZ45_13035 [Salmonella enterica subsp. enterica serovar Weslaco str. 247K]|nr:hypothetical protein LFZ45_13035 [Salmonella enterica subsp. enterica serovar Weslaco str. 247K]
MFQSASASKCCWICIDGVLVNIRTITLSLPPDASIMTRQFFSRPLTRSLPPWAAADPNRRLNNP